MTEKMTKKMNELATELVNEYLIIIYPVLDRCEIPYSENTMEECAESNFKRGFQAACDLQQERIEKLYKYLHHDDECNCIPCDCGLSKILKEGE